jgi:dihydrofolate reductase
MKLSIMAAVSENDVLGKNGELVWSLPADQQYLAESVRGRVGIMGRVSYQGFRDAHPHTRCVVISSQAELPLATDDVRAASFAEAIKLAADQTAPTEEVFVLGGAGVYAEALPLADHLYLTRVHHTFDGDTFFPPIDFDAWTLEHAESHAADAENEYAFTFLRYARRAPIDQR